MANVTRPINPPRIAGLEFIRVLGRGGFGDVFEYQQDVPRRKVAVKVLLSKPGVGDVAARLRDEANAMAELSQHPNIVTVFGVGTSDDNRPYLIMECYPNTNLGKTWRSSKMPLTRVLQIGVQLAGAIESAHRRGVLHRDIKPANILFDLNSRPVLSDFGIASTLSPRTTQVTGLSVPWSPPEALAQEPVASPQSDVWSLAATIYSLLASRAPFEYVGEDNSIMTMTRRIEAVPYVPINRPDVPPSLEQVLRTAMAKDPAARYQSGAAFGNALRAVQVELGYQPTDLEVLSDAADFSLDISAEADALAVTYPRPLSAQYPSITPSDPSPVAFQPAESATMLRNPPPQPTPLPPPKRHTGLILAIILALIAVTGAIVVTWLVTRNTGETGAPSPSVTVSIPPLTPSVTPTPTPSETPSPTPTPTPVVNPGDLVDGTAYSYGEGNYGLLGNGSDTKVKSPEPIPGLTDVTQVAAAAEAAYALKADGTLWAWGRNQHGQLGIGSTKAQATPQLVEGLGTVVQVAAGWGNAYAIDAEGNLWGWGVHYGGEKQSVVRKKPAQIALPEAVSKVTASAYSGFALTASGNVYGWGSYTRNAKGWVDNPKPQLISGLPAATALASGIGSAYALDADGNVWAWGDNRQGELGIGKDKYSEKPKQLELPEPIVAIAASGENGYALATSGQVYAWGNKPAGLGKRTTTPTPIADLSDITAISATHTKLVAYRADGTVLLNTTAQPQLRGATQVAGADESDTKLFNYPTTYFALRAVAGK